MTSVFRRGWNWFRRFRHRKGYGVHSPADFYFITFVIYEEGAYYAYHFLQTLRENMAGTAFYREKVDKLLLRLVNYLQPDGILELGTGCGIDTCYLAAGKRCDVLTLEEKGEGGTQTSGMLSAFPQIRQRKGNLCALLKAELAANPLPRLVHLAHTERYRECFEALIPHATSDTCLIVGRPHADTERLRWWKEVTKDPRTGVTFDLYDIGIVFFDGKRSKENRVVNFL